MKNAVSIKLLNVTLYAMLIIIIGLIITLPWALNLYIDVFEADIYYSGNARIFIMIFLIVVGVFVTWIVGELIFMMKTIEEDPFVERNAEAFRRMGNVAMILAILFFLKCFSYFTLLTCMCGIMLAICSLVAFTLRHIFRQAVIYKNENDLTI